LEYFYSDDQTTVKAYKNMYAQKMEQVANFMMLKMETVADGEKIIKSLKEIATLRGCYNEEKDPIPDELLQKKIFVYDFDAEKLGLPKADRNAVKKFIEEKIPELPEKHKQRLFEEADIIQFKAFPDVKEDPRKN
jgi:predicted ester cyclase